MKINYLKKATLILLLLSSFAGRTQVNLDSLWSVWNNPNEADTNKLNAIHEIALRGYLFSQPDSAFFFAQMQYNLAKTLLPPQGKQKKGGLKQMGDALNIQGVSFDIRGEPNKAVKYYNESLKIREEIGDKQGIASSLNNIGMIYDGKGDYNKAIQYYNKSLKIREEIGDKIGIANSHNNIAVIYSFQGNYSEAINSNINSLKIREEIDDKKGVANSYNNIGILYKNQGDLNKALEYYNKSLEIHREIENKGGIASSYTNIGIAYDLKGNSEIALEYYYKSLKIKEEINDKQNIPISLLNIGSNYAEKGDYQKAHEYYIKGLEIYEELGDKKGIASSLVEIGGNYSLQGNINEAIEFNTKALNIASEIGAAIETRATARSLYENYKSIGKHKSALEMHELYIQTRDSLLSKSNQKELIRQEYKYSYEKQAATDSVKNAETQKVKDAQLTAEKAENIQQRQLSYFLYGVIGLAILFGGFIFNRFKITNNQKKIIEKQKNKVDEAFGELEEKNTEILDSINYAKRIQSAILPTNKLIKESLRNSFVFYKPKDIVAGDFYWMEASTPLSLTTNDGSTELGQSIILFAVADCTGHGVPGAMVSVVCNNALNRSVREFNLTEPGKILDKTREIVIQEFEKSEEEVKDGMDIALCSLEFSVPRSSLKGDNLISEEKQKTENKKRGTVAKLQYAGAHNPLWIIRNGEILETKANKQPIGKFDQQTPYTTHTLELQKGDSIYIFSDGYVDQFGGEKSKKFKSVNFKEFLLTIQKENMEKQKNLLDEKFEKWRGDLEQIDDVCVIGVKI